LITYGGKMFSTAPTRAGKVIKQLSGKEEYFSFIPRPLPPNPPLIYDDEIKNKDRVYWSKEGEGK